MKFWVSFVFVLTFIASCKKEVPLTIPFPLVDLKSGCLNSKIGESPGSRYTALAWNDEFEGPKAGEDLNCYSMKPICSERLDVFGADECPADTNTMQLHNLNKCKWTLWSGYAFWSPQKTLRYHPNQIFISNGTLKFKQKRQYTKKSFLCGSKDFDCPYWSGGMDSKYRSASTPGRNIKNGRVEIRAKIPAKKGGYPAFWAWPVDWQTGYPYVSGGIWHTGEQDILEASTKEDGRIVAFQTYHDYSTSPPSSSMGKFFILEPNQFYRFGMERLDGELRFYVGSDSIENCYTEQIKQGDRGLKLSDFPNFVMLNYAMVPETNFIPIGSAEDSEIEIDYVRFYEK